MNVSQLRDVLDKLPGNAIVTVVRTYYGPVEVTGVYTSVDYRRLKGESFGGFTQAGQKDMRVLIAIIS